MTHPQSGETVTIQKLEAAVRHLAEALTGEDVLRGNYVLVVNRAIGEPTPPSEPQAGTAGLRWNCSVLRCEGKPPRYKVRSPTGYALLETGVFSREAGVHVTYVVRETHAEALAALNAATTPPPDWKPDIDTNGDETCRQQITPAPSTSPGQRGESKHQTLNLPADRSRLVERACEADDGACSTGAMMAENIPDRRWVTLRRSGDDTIVEVELNGQIIATIRERLDENFSHGINVTLYEEDAKKKSTHPPATQERKPEDTRICACLGDDVCSICSPAIPEPSTPRDEDWLPEGMLTVDHHYRLLMQQDMVGCDDGMKLRDSQWRSAYLTLKKERDEARKEKPVHARDDPQTYAGSQAVKRAFTLIDLLVVIAIIALLVGILLPALGKSRSRARTLVCQSNQRSAGQIVQLYAEEQKNLPFTTEDITGGFAWTGGERPR